MNDNMKAKLTNPKILEIVKIIMVELKDLGPFIDYISRYNSVYIKFQNKRLGCLRIGDHKERTHYPDKWNILIGGETKEGKGKIKRFYFNEKSIRRFIKRIYQYHQIILSES